MSNNLVEYTSALAQALSDPDPINWFRIDEVAEGTNYQDASALVLVHPVWYAPNGGLSETFCEIRGQRNFSNKQPSAGTKCGSFELWGYECPFDAVRLSPDHRWPWSLGGPTEGPNLLWLCKEHNQAKGSDWHTVIEVPCNLTWFERTLERVRKTLELSS